MSNKNILIATIKQWNIENANKLKKALEGKYNIHIISSKDELQPTANKINPKYIFFPHWSWKIPKDIYSSFECIGFHITDLPFGKGGSPLQNLIKRKIYNTKITAFKIEEKLDSGDIYLKKDFYIGLGSAEEIFLKSSQIIFFEMIPYIIEKNPIPRKQEEVNALTFRRRTPEESNLMEENFSSLDEIYDFIRMLDAEGYPKAFIKIGKFKIEFSEVHRKHNKLVGRFEVIYDEENTSSSGTS